MAIPTFNTFGSVGAFSNTGSVRFVPPVLGRGGTSGTTVTGDLSRLLAILNDLGSRFVAEAMHEAQALCDEALRMSDSVVHRITGELAGSGVVAVISGNEIQYRYDKEYAGYEEFGNRYREGHPYFRPSAQYIRDNLGAKMELALKAVVGG